METFQVLCLRRVVERDEHLNRNKINTHLPRVVEKRVNSLTDSLHVMHELLIFKNLEYESIIDMKTIQNKI